MKTKTKTKTDTNPHDVHANTKAVLNEILERCDQLGPAKGGCEEIAKLCEVAQQTGFDADVMAQIVDRLGHGNDEAKDLAERLTAPAGTPPTVALAPVIEDSLAESSTEGAARAPIPLSKIGISIWNRSYDASLDDSYVAGMKKSIETDGLMHPITLVRDPDDPTRPYKAVAGAGRRAAVMQIRGEAGMLEPGEYRLLANITEADAEACTRISVSENEDRRASSVNETARQVQRLLGSKTLKHNQVASLLRIPRETVGKLVDLVAYFDQLPDSWQVDLSAVPGGDSTHKPAITRSHWDKVAATVKKEHGVTPKLKKAMEAAHAQTLSVAKFDEQLNPKPKLPNSKPPAGVTQKNPNTMTERTTADPKDDDHLPSPAPEPKTPEDSIRQAARSLDEAVTFLGSDQQAAASAIRMVSKLTLNLLDELGKEVTDAAA
jgi:hypothetical protein